MLEYVGTLRVPIGSTPARVVEEVRNMNLPWTRCLHAAVIVAVLRIRDIFVRIRGSVPLTKGSGFGSDSGSCFFLQ
jgi:hypothetical protein